MNWRHLSIWLMVAAFVLNGAAALAFVEIPETLVPISADHHATSVSGDRQTHVAPRRDDGTVVIGSQSLTHQHAENCLKCCNMCSVASMIPESLKAPVRFSYAGIAFRIGLDDFFGRFVGLDPGIPKSVI